MTSDETPGSAGDEPEESTGEPDAKPDTKPDVAEETPRSDDDGAEPAKKDTTEDDLKSTATDQNKARQLARDNRARADAVAAILGGTTRATNIFVGSTIGFVETGGQQPVDGSRGSVATGSVTDETLRGVATTFVEPAGYGELRARLRRQSVILLRAAPGWGRTTTALHLLSNECVQGVEKLNPDVSLRVPRELELRSGRGHLLEWLDVDEASRLHTFHFERLKHALDERGARMIVLLEPTTPIREDILSSYVVECGAPPDSRAVVARHFAAHLAMAGKTDQNVADYPEFADLIGEFVETARRVGSVAEFARDLGEVVLGRIDLSAIRDRYADTAETAFREWFDGLDDNDQRAFAVALAVFNGMPMHTVAGAQATQLGEEHAGSRESGPADAAPIDLRAAPRRPHRAGRGRRRGRVGGHGPRTSCRAGGPVPGRPAATQAPRARVVGVQRGPRGCPEVAVRAGAVAGQPSLRAGRRRRRTVEPFRVRPRPPAGGRALGGHELLPRARSGDGRAGTTEPAGRAAAAAGQDAVRVDEVGLDRPQGRGRQGTGFLRGRLARSRVEDDAPGGGGEGLLLGRAVSPSPRP